MSETESKGYNTNPLDKRVAERAEAEMGTAPEPGVDSEAPTREMAPENRPIAGGPTREVAGPTAPNPGPTSPVAGSWSGPVAEPTHGLYEPPSPAPHASGHEPPPAAPHPHGWADPNPQAQWPPRHPPYQPGAYPERPSSTGGFDAYKQEGSAALGLKPNFAAMVAYTPFVGGIAALLLVLTEPSRNRFVHFHARQALIGHIAFWVLAMALRVGVNYGPGLIGFILMFPWSGLYLLYLIGFIMMMAKAYNGERAKIPIIGEQAE